MLVVIQRELKAPKNQKNAFGGYKYRSAEDILDAVKKHLDTCTLTLTDDIVHVASAHAPTPLLRKDKNGDTYADVIGGDRFYVKSTACLSDGVNVIQNTAFAREEDNKKGMDASQITGSASSYARKYALNGLFAIDDTQDADGKDNTKDLIPTHTTVRTPEGTISTPKQEESFMCPLHNVPFEKKTGKFGEFWSHQLEGGTYCNKK